MHTFYSTQSQDCITHRTLFILSTTVVLSFCDVNYIECDFLNLNFVFASKPKLFSLLAPSPPLGLMAYNTSSTSIMVTWQLPQYPNGFIRGYQVRYLVLGGNSSFVNVSMALTSAQLTGLLVYTVYNVSVRALTIGYSNFTDVFTVSTDEGGKYSSIYKLIYWDQSQFADEIKQFHDCAAACRLVL